MNSNVYDTNNHYGGLWTLIDKVVYLFAVKQTSKYFLV